MTDLPYQESGSSQLPIDFPRFSALPEFKTRRSAAFASSVLVHAATICALLFWSVPLKQAPSKPFLQHYSVRFVQLQVPEPSPRSDIGGASVNAARMGGIQTSNQAADTLRAASISAPLAPQAPRAEPRKFELPNLPQRRRVEQTLVQMELPPDVAPRVDIRVPAVALWDGRTANLPRPPARKFIAPARKEVAKVHQSVLAEPTLELPNLEQNIADLNFSAVRLTDVPLLPKPPSSTSPIRIVNSSQSGQIPQSATADSAQHEPANIISIPDMPIPAAKVLLIPALNQVATALLYGAGGQGNGLGGSPGDTGSGSGGASSNGKAAAGPGTGGGGGGSASKASDGAGATSAGVAGPGHGAGEGASGRGNLAGTGASAGAGNGAGAGTSSGMGNGVGSGSTPSVAKIVRPMDGHFSAVVLGSSATQAYPEAVGALGGRLVYTVYLRVGTKKSWILQYCLPRPAEPAVKLKGTATPVDPPYPFLILRPDLTFAPQTDYLIVHGVVNSAGKFEQLSIVGLTGFAQEHLLLSSLELWQFRPAARDGQATTVEVLLIIPREEV